MWTYIDRQYIQAIYFLIFPIISISRNVSSVFTPKGTIFYPPSHTHRALTWLMDVQKTMKTQIFFRFEKSAEKGTYHQEF